MVGVSGLGLGSVGYGLLCLCSPPTPPPPSLSLFLSLSRVYVCACVVLFTWLLFCVVSFVVLVTNTYEGAETCWPASVVKHLSSQCQPVSELGLGLRL